VGRACGMHGRGEKHVQGSGDRPKGKDHLKDQGVDGKMGSKWTLGRLVWGVEWIRLAQDRDRWWALVNVVMNPQVLEPQSWLVG
jgi:hypothetical protein